MLLLYVALDMTKEVTESVLETSWEVNTSNLQEENGERLAYERMRLYIKFSAKNKYSSVANIN